MTGPRPRILGGRLVRTAFGLAAVALAVAAVVANWQEFVAALRSLSVASVAVSGVCAVLGVCLGMMSWRRVLADIGHPLGVVPAGRLFFVGQLGKYVPGSVWSFAAQADLGRDHRIPARRSVTALLLALLILLACSLALALVLLGISGDSGGAYAWAYLALPVLLVGLHPIVLRRSARWAGRLLHRDAVDVSPTHRGILGAAVWGTTSFLVLGLQALALVGSLHTLAPGLVARVIGAVAFAWAVGLLAVVAPAGAGVRELVLVAVLTPELSQGDALVVAVVCRVLVIAADLVLAGSVLAVARVQDRREPL